MKNYREIIKKALERIKSEYLQNNVNIINPEINWVGLEGKIYILSEIAKELLETEDEVLREIENVANIISNKSI